MDLEKKTPIINFLLCNIFFRIAGAFLLQLLEYKGKKGFPAVSKIDFHLFFLLCLINDTKNVTKFLSKPYPVGWWLMSNTFCITKAQEAQTNYFLLFLYNLPIDASGGLLLKMGTVLADFSKEAKIIFLYLCREQTR